MADKNIKLAGSYQQPIYYEDTDFSGYVYHANYLKFFERAREHLLTQPLLVQLYQQFQTHFVVQRADCQFHRPAGFAQQLLIETEMSISRSPLVAVRQCAYLKNNAQKTMVVSADLILVCVNAVGKPQRISTEIQQLLEKSGTPMSLKRTSL